MKDCKHQWFEVGGVYGRRDGVFHARTTGGVRVVCGKCEERKESWDGDYWVTITKK